MHLTDKDRRIDRWKTGCPFKVGDEVVPKFGPHGWTEEQVKSCIVVEITDKKMIRVNHFPDRDYTPSLFRYKSMAYINGKGWVNVYTFYGKYQLQEEIPNVGKVTKLN